ncbi:G-protein coupled receptor Mth2-like [Leguminivora glycinivorella]|uniref:G-protein coupled receptor Mth2-like n=1 Tax=Leguminivora glycinivorella TaxID=1035111 RepID=UPI00200C7AF5|nr:G-protein coupled receptor Mth2-like [Leguminivora glycinivorella]
MFNVTKLEDFEVNIYNKDVVKKISKTGESLKSFRFVYSDAFNGALEMKSLQTAEFYILEDGSTALRKRNYLNQWPYPLWNYTRHCIEVQAIRKNGVVDSVGLIHRVILERKRDGNVMEFVVASAMLISCLFLLLTLLAYCVLPQKRNLPALMLMALVTCLTTTFLFRAVQVFTMRPKPPRKIVCNFIGLVLYYSLWACFTWMNVMSYDMWRNWTSACSHRWQPHSKITTKFWWYSTYGFGVPLVLMAFTVGIDYADLTSVPEIVKPHFVNGNYCYFETQSERRLYVTGPILVATIINIIFFILTARYISQNSAKPGGTGDSRNTKKDQNRFVIYLKLTVITGISWLLDVMAEFIEPQHWGWLIVDILNSLTGCYIFWAFICKKEMIVLLFKRFKIKTSFARQWESTVVTSVSVTKRQLSEKETPTEQKPEFFSDKPGFNRKF